MLVWCLCLLFVEWAAWHVHELKQGLRQILSNFNFIPHDCLKYCGKFWMSVHQAVGPEAWGSWRPRVVFDL